MSRAVVPAALAAVLLSAGSLQAVEKVPALKWREIAPGEAEARKTGKPALYFFTAEWCGPCHTIQREVFADPKIAASVEKRYVPILCEDRYREDGANPAGFDDLARRFGLRGFPTLIVARPGSKKGIRLTGWPGVEDTRQYLEVAGDRLKEKEAEAAKGRPAGDEP